MAFFESLGMKAYLLPKNECGYIGKERQLKGSIDILVFKSNCNSSIRFIKLINKLPVSVIQIMFDDKIYTIANVFTLETYRRKGYAKELYFFANKKLRSKIFHSSKLSSLGKKFASNLN